MSGRAGGGGGSTGGNGGLMIGGPGSGSGGNIMPPGGNLNELLQLLEQDIPECRRHLQDSHANLDKVAAYCLSNYLQAQDKRHALEETKNYTTQSLASVAYQINMLATNFLHLLDLQMNQISDMESSINHLSQIVMIHREKVARREIGELTTNKATTRPPGVKQPGILFPEHAERPMKYIRKPIDYTVLDSVGHGVKSQSQQQPQRHNSTSLPRSQPGSTGSNPTVQMIASQQAPSAQPSTPPTMYQPGMGTLRGGKSSPSPYRSPAPPISPPSVPGNYAPNYPSMQRVGSNYAPGGVMLQQGGMMGQAPMKAVSPMPQNMPVGGASGAVTGTPLVRQMSMGQPTLSISHDSQHPYISDPIPMGDYHASLMSSSVSPPLPPPPGVEGNGSQRFDSHPSSIFDMGVHNNGGMGGEYGGGGNKYSGGVAAESYAGRISRMELDEADWIPANYIEKVVAIYNYTQDKDDELTFDEGAVIYVVKKNDDGWWEGVMEGRTGLFPGNYVEPCI